MAHRLTTDQQALRQAEQAVAFEWKPGDVILDLYEVRPVRRTTVRQASGINGRSADEMGSYDA